MRKREEIWDAKKRMKKQRRESEREREREKGGEEMTVNESLC